MITLLPQNTSITEQMDKDDCDLSKLKNTYRAFSYVNKLVSGWSWIWKKEVEPLLLPGNFSIADIGCGGGDIAWDFIWRADKVGKTISVVGVDPDKRAIRYARKQYNYPRLTFKNTKIEDLPDNYVDVATCNHLIHHLEEDQIPDFFQHLKRIARKKVIVNDIHRSLLAFIGYPLIALPYARNSFLMTDGLRSIRKAFTRNELLKIAGEGWEKEIYLPFRSVLIYDHQKQNGCGA